ncbi:hypothetical protein T01_2735 [Trichinella spiralis]|uniref:Uncharacterized protein n=1 Tax=Trichinella spiralis TaxID=6334 RepID=A0A0V0YVT5_TRISP|nr:hypothetical protein T01_2735 [Trichinella spiralis]
MKQLRGLDSLATTICSFLLDVNFFSFRFFIQKITAFT